MTATVDESPRGGASWVFWTVAGVSLLWNAYGAYMYTMCHLQGEAYLRQMGMTDAQVAYMLAYPTWMHAVWAIGVWGSALGSVLLLLRMKWAFHAFAVSLLGVVGMLIYQYVLTDALAVDGMMGVGMNVVITGVVLFLTWYSRRMTKAGVLR